EIPQHLLNHQLAAAIGIGGGGGEILADRNARRVAVYGRRRREDDGFAARFPHDLEQGEGSRDVVVVIGEGLFDRFADRLQPGESRLMCRPPPPRRRTRGGIPWRWCWKGRGDYRPIRRPASTRRKASPDQGRGPRTGGATSRGRGCRPARRGSPAG